MDYELVNVTEDVDSWFNRDPVRPELNIEFRTGPGREVFGLKDEDGEYKAFMCIARTDGVPANTEELSSLTSLFGKIVVPYSVWSYKRGAGREIVNQVLLSMKRVKTVSRVITLSPLTDMARNFHLRNSAFELRVNETTVNFEYIL